MSESLPHQPADPASAADPTTTPGSLTPVAAAGGGPTTDQLTDRLRFYESFDELIQQNIARSSQLLREAAAKRDEAVAEIAMAKRTVAAERETQRGNLSELLDDVMAIQQAAERLAHRVSDALEQIEFAIEPDGLGLGGLGGGTAAAAGSGFGLLSGRHGSSTDAEVVHSEVATGVLGQQPGYGATAASPTIGSGIATGSPFTAAGAASSDTPVAAAEAAPVPLGDEPSNSERDLPPGDGETPVDAPPVGAAVVAGDDLNEPEPGSGPEAAPLESSAAGWRDQPPLVDLADVVDDGAGDVDSDYPAVADGGDPVMAEDEATSMGSSHVDGWSDVPAATDADPVAIVDAEQESWSEPGPESESADPGEPTVASTAETVDDLDLSAAGDDAPATDWLPADAESADAVPAGASTPETGWSATAETQDLAATDGTGPGLGFGHGDRTDELIGTSVETDVTGSAPDSRATDEADRDDTSGAAGDVAIPATAASTDVVTIEPAATDQPDGPVSDEALTTGVGATPLEAERSADAPQPAIEPPVVEPPVVETPVVEPPVVEPPVVETPVVGRPVMAAPDDVSAPVAPPVPAVEEQTTLVLDGVPRAATALAIQRHVLANDAVFRAEVREYYDHRLTLFVTATRPLQVSDLEGWDASATWEQVAATPDRLEMRLEM